VAETPLWQQPVTYGAVGGTKAQTLAAYPPPGFRPLVRRRRIGHGDNRFESASARVMTWGIQRLSGMTVEVAETPPEVTDGTYQPVVFDESGAVFGRSTLSGEAEEHFGPDGLPYLVPGETAVLTIPFLLIRTRAPVRVVYVIDEPNRRGFAYGTLKGHPERGEEAFVIERTGDGSVWLTIAAFSRPSTWYWHVLFIPLRAAQAVYTRRYLRVLAGTTDPEG